MGHLCVIEIKLRYFLDPMVIKAKAACRYVMCIFQGPGVLFL